MILQGKNVLIYGAAGSMGSSLAWAMAEAGARLFLSGRTLATVEAVATRIRSSHGHASAHQVDALDEEQVSKFLDRVVVEAGTIDVSCTLIDWQVVQNIPLVDMKVDDFTRPSAIALRSHFLTATGAAKIMMRQKSGVILSLTATPGGIGYPFTAGFAPACAAVESFMRNLASEVGPAGVRAVNIRSGGSPDSRVFKEALEQQPKVVAPILAAMERDTMLGKLPSMRDIAQTAVFLASSHAASITGTTIDVTAGTTAALNYRAK